MRKRVLGLYGSGLIISVVPKDFDLGDLIYDSIGFTISVTDQNLFHLDIQKFAVNP